MLHSSRRASAPAWVLLAPIRFYQRFITPYTPASCRFYPTCSTYAVTALREHGAVKGSWLALRRLGRCHPWSEGGIDYVPPRPARSGAVGEPPARDESCPGDSSTPAVGADARPAAPIDRSPVA